MGGPKISPSSDQPIFFADADWPTLWVNSPWAWVIFVTTKHGYWLVVELPIPEIG